MIPTSPIGSPSVPPASVDFDPRQAGSGSGPGENYVDNTRNRTLVILRNDSEDPRTVTIGAQQTSRPHDYPSEGWPEGTVVDIVKVVPPDGIIVFYGLPNAYNDAAGRLHLTYDETEDLTLQAFEILKV